MTRQTKITDVCKIDVGRTPSRSNPLYWGEGLPWLSIADMNQGSDLEKTKETITPKAISECKCKIVPKNSVLMSFKLSIGKVGVTKIPMYTNEAIAAFVIKDHTVLDTKYLFYALKSKDHSIGSNKAVMGKTLNKAQLEKIEIPVPSINKQRQITELLDKADALRKKRGEALKSLDEYLRSVFLTMFKDDDELEQATFESLSADHKGSMRTGPFGSDLKHSEFVGSGVAVLGIDNAVKNHFAWDKRRFISSKKYEKLKRYTIYPRDVIVTIMGTTGRSAVIPDDIPIAINTKHLAAITFDESKANPYFMCYALQTDPRIKRQISQRSKGAIMDGLNLTIIKNLELTAWPIELQNKFEVIYHEVEKLKQEMTTQADLMETQFSALMQKAFDGIK